MSPRVIMYNSISLDGSIRDFELDVGLHYELADKVKADAHLIGSETAKTGIEIFTEQIPLEAQSDFFKPVTKLEDKKPLWVISDSRGKLKGLLHVYRRSCYCRDVIILVTNKTPDDYIAYLKERNYNMIIAGDEKIDFRFALDKLALLYNVKTVLTDSGGGLNSVLIQEGLIDELSLLISPMIVGKSSTNLFRYVENKVNLELIRTERIRNNHLLVFYRVLSNINISTPVNLGDSSSRIKPE
jgi:2,5-diamino-6-(ribosylamino)-4(3H)-pyrimidinone 5'-phosphate reductase